MLALDTGGLLWLLPGHMVRGSRPGCCSPASRQEVLPESLVGASPPLWAGAPGALGAGEASGCQAGLISASQTRVLS